MFWDRSFHSVTTYKSVIVAFSSCEYLTCVFLGGGGGGVVCLCINLCWYFVGSTLCLHVGGSKMIEGEFEC
jgi:hypothetical protein